MSRPSRSATNLKGLVLTVSAAADDEGEPPGSTDQGVGLTGGDEGAGRRDRGLSPSPRSPRKSISYRRRQPQGGMEKTSTQMASTFWRECLAHTGSSP